MNIVVFAREDTMRPDRDLDQSVARRAAANARFAFAAKTEHLSVAHACGDRHVELDSIGQSNVPLGAIDGVEKVEVEMIMNVRSAPAQVGSSFAAKHS